MVAVRRSSVSSSSSSSSLYSSMRRSGGKLCSIFGNCVFVVLLFRVFREIRENSLFGFLALSSVTLVLLLLLVVVLLVTKLPCSSIICINSCSVELSSYFLGFGSAIPAGIHSMDDIIFPRSPMKMALDENHTIYIQYII